MAPQPPPKWGRLHCGMRSSGAPPVVATTNDGVLPLDLLYDILLRLPTETICRFRAVCRSWKSVLCHPDFIAAARNPGPLIAIGMCYPSNEVNVLDLESGYAIKRVKVATKENLVSVGAISHHCLVCVVNPDGSQLCLLDLTSGVVSTLPDIQELPQQGFTFYNVGSTRWERKLLAVTNASIWQEEQQVCNILTLGDDDGGGSWRGTGHPPLHVEWQTSGCAVIDGTAYFLPEYPSDSMEIMAFDFESEAWRPSLGGPAGKHPCICLADMDDHLVAGRADSFEFELWFLVGSYWSKRYTITVTSGHQNHYWPSCYDYIVKPLAVLEDGRIVLWMRVAGVKLGTAYNMMQIYDPRTKTFMDGTRVSDCRSVRAFRWNLLHSGPTSGAIDMVAKRLLINRRCQHHSRPSPGLYGGTLSKGLN